eukprot:1265594-Prymnesium_polylepis.1
MSQLAQAPNTLKRVLGAPPPPIVDGRRVKRSREENVTRNGDNCAQERRVCLALVDCPWRTSRRPFRPSGP